MAEQDRLRTKRNLVDTEYLARGIAGLRLTFQDIAMCDFMHSELHGILKDLCVGIATDAINTSSNEAEPESEAGGASHLLEDGRTGQ